jgi:hypothetical protein
MLFYLEIEANVHLLFKDSKKCNVYRQQSLFGRIDLTLYLICCQNSLNK